MKRFALLPLAASLLLVSCNQGPSPRINPIPSPFNAALSATGATVPRGGATTTVTVGTSSPATFTVSGAPTGMLVDHRGDRFILTNAAAADGLYPLTVTVRPTDGRAPVTLPFTLTTTGGAREDALILTATPSVVTLNAGEQAFVTVTSNVPASLVVIPRGDGLEATLNGNVITVRNVSAPAGQQEVDVFGTGPRGDGGFTRFVVNVPGTTTPSPGPGEFTATVSPGAVTVNRGASSTVTVSGNQAFTFTGGQVAGITTSVSGNNITVTNASAPNGTHSLPITVTGGGQTRSLTVSVTATGATTTPPPANFTPPGTPIVSALSQESQALALVNELRTQGTLNGDAAVRNGTCAANWSPVPALQYHGGLHFAARKHGDYLAVEIVRTGEISGNPHVQENPANPHFYASFPTDRMDRAYAEHNFAPLAGMGGTENIAYGDNAYNAVASWLRSPAHCAGLMNSASVYGAIGMGSTGARTGQYGVLHTWVLKTGGAIR